MVKQSERFNWYTRDRAEASGPLGRKADIFFSGTGQWASQTVSIASSGPFLRSRLLFGNVRGRFELTRRDQLEGQFSGTRIDLSNWGIPQGVEPLAGSAGGPSFQPPFGFAGLREEDHLDAIHAGWNRQFSPLAVLQVRYAFSPAHLDTAPVHPLLLPSRTELVSELGQGIPPIANLAVRTRQAVQGALDLGSVPGQQKLAVGGGLEMAKIRNRLTAPADAAEITAAGAPSYVVQLNTPLDSREKVRQGTIYLRDRVNFSWLTMDAALVGDFSRGAVPRQSSPQGSYAPERQFEGSPDLIRWNSLSPRFGLAAAALGVMVLRANYLRSYAPLACRYLDYGNPNSLGGPVYSDGRLVRTFGGPYSRIDPNLHRPYADEFNVGVETSFSDRLVASLTLFRRDEKQRIAAVQTGVPSGAFRAVFVLDPGPDGITGTVDDQELTVYSQDPSSFGKDRYLLTNPPGLRELNRGLTAELSARTRYFQAHASFMAVKAWGPANPGNAVLQNDPGVIGALYQDPNSLIHAAGRSFFDRAYVGKFQIGGNGPANLGRLEWASTVNYLDGLVFGRRLLVASLPQGPILVAATVRGSPEGGNRSEYLLQWNLRVSRNWELRYGRLRAGFDLFNVLNANNRLQESDASGPLFNQRLPIAIQSARFARVSVQYRF